MPKQRFNEGITSIANVAINIVIRKFILISDHQCDKESHTNQQL